MWYHAVIFTQYINNIENAVAIQAKINLKII